MIMSEFMFYFKQGLYHVLDWNAYDHILFLIVLTVSYTFDSWRRILILVTLFTVGHTVSLFLAAFNVVSVNSALVEFLIPITILIAALFNIFSARSGSKDSRAMVSYGVTIFFGLIHGLGFSSYFKMIGSDASSKILALLEFALGIEVSQIIIVLVVLLIGFIAQTFLRFTKRDWTLIVSSIVIGMIIPMLIENKIW